MNIFEKYPLPWTWESMNGEIRYLDANHLYVPKSELRTNFQNRLTNCLNALAGIENPVEWVGLARTFGTELAAIVPKYQGSQNRVNALGGRLNAELAVKKELASRIAELEKELSILTDGLELSEDIRSVQKRKIEKLEAKFDDGALAQCEDAQKVLRSEIGTLRQHLADVANSRKKDIAAAIRFFTGNSVSESDISDWSNGIDPTAPTDEQ